jgi:putative membrane protein
MVAVAVAFGLAAGGLHIGFWVMESLLWRQPRIWKRFGARSQEDADTMAFGMLNQGYYNLFLGLGAVVGAILLAVDTDGSIVLLAYSCLFMLGAAVVLAVARPSMLRAALIQGAPPAIALGSLALL